jgi:hypothetical protein
VEVIHNDRHGTMISFHILRRRVEDTDDDGDDGDGDDADDADDEEDWRFFDDTIVIGRDEEEEGVDGVDDNAVTISVYGIDIPIMDDSTTDCDVYNEASFPNDFNNGRFYIHIHTYHV